MAFYTTYGKFQQQMKEYFLRTGQRMQFPEMVDYMYLKGLLEEADPVSLPPHEFPDEAFDDMSDECFEQLNDSFILNVTPHQVRNTEVMESDIIPNQKDVFIIRHPRYTRPAPHSHNYFEINYVASGSCTFHFEGENHTLQNGEFCIIAPGSSHDLVIDDDSIVYCIMLRKSTFHTTFFSLRSGRDLLSYFFRSILQNDTHSNYLLFFSENNKEIKHFVRSAMLESYRNDSYSNACCISYINLMFTNLLRSYSKTLQFYDYPTGTDFSLVLQYIQHNYQTLTLSGLADIFHYSEPHLCTLIKQNTGHSFTDLIKELRMADAINYLVNTNEKISEIAEHIGYNSADHFSRVFRNTYHMSPQEYRKTHKDEHEDFRPFTLE